MTNKVSYIIQLKDRFSRVGNKVSQNFKKIDSDAKKLDNTIKGRLSRSMDKLNKSAKGKFGGGGFALGALASAGGILTIGSKFQDAVAELSAITGAEGSALDAMANDSLRMAKRFGISQEIVARAMTQTASAKSELLKNPKSLSIVTEQALLLSKAAGIDVPSAIRASIGALNQWDEGADQAARFVNVIAAGAKVGASMVGETAEALKNAGSVAAQFGLSFEETNALVQILAKNEIKGAEAGTALRGTLSKLEKFMGGRIAPSKVGIIKSLAIIEKLGRSNTQVIKEFGEENLRSILILRKNIPLLKQWTSELTSTSIATDQASIRSDVFSEKLKKLGVSAKGVAIKIFEGWEPVLSFLAEKLTTIVNLVDSIISGSGEVLGQSLAAVISMDFGQFDTEAMKRAFTDPFKGSVPMAPTAANGVVTGEITVKAEQGTAVKSAKVTSKGQGVNLGLNMATN